MPGAGRGEGSQHGGGAPKWAMACGFGKVKVIDWLFWHGYMLNLASGGLEGVQVMSGGHLARWGREGWIGCGKG